jgi:hypothetical protein
MLGIIEQLLVISTLHSAAFLIPVKLRGSQFVRRNIHSYRSIQFDRTEVTTVSIIFNHAYASSRYTPDSIQIQLP